LVDEFVFDWLEVLIVCLCGEVVGGDGYLDDDGEFDCEVVVDVDELCMVVVDGVGECWVDVWWEV